MSLAYPILSIGVIAWILPLWTRTEWYYQGAAEELGVGTHRISGWLDDARRRKKPMYATILGVKP